MSDWKNIIASVAPTLATALGGPLAGMAVKAISGAVLGHENGTEKELQAVLAGATPDDLLKLKNADQEFELKMAELGVNLEKIAADDRNSARDLQKSTKSKIVPVLAGLTVAGFFGVVFWALSLNITLESTLLGFVLGQVSTKAEQVYNYYFGSSAGSKQKTSILGENKS